MSRLLRYNLTYLGTIELEDDEELNDSQILSLIADDAYDNYNAEIEYANDIDYSIDDIDYQAEIAEYERIAEVNPYCI